MTPIEIAIVVAVAAVVFFVLMKFFRWAIEAVIIFVLVLIGLYVAMRVLNYNDASDAIRGLILDIRDMLGL
jgi:hypothetical protein